MSDSPDQGPTADATIPDPHAPEPRPRSVVALVVLTVLTGVLDLVLAVLLVVAVGADQLPAGVTQEELRAAAIVYAALGIAVLVLAVRLWQGSNGARVILTVVTATRLVGGLVLVARFDVSDATTGVLMVAGAGLTTWLLWNPASTAFFEGRRERIVRVLRDRAGRHGVLGDVRAWATDAVVRVVVLALTILLMPGIDAESWLAVLLAVAMVSLVAWVLRPVFVLIAARFGWFGATVLALFSNAIVLGLALWVTPGVTVDSVIAAVLASWVYALVMTVVSWVASTRTLDYLLVHATRMHGPSDEVPDPEVEGVLFVQLDGVPAPVLEYELRAGNLPNLSAWMRSGSHTWREWTARVPSTTPVSQAGLLHGTTEGIPAFRWYEKEEGRLVVANKPEDAALIESRLSDGRGLLADDGVSISNLFSGDAPTSLLTMSGLRERGKGLGMSRSYAAFFTHPAGFSRALVLTIGEMAKEVFQARRQRRRDVQPRIHRSGSYVALRAVTNVLLRDLNVALVVDAMMSGARSIYVDFVDYDEIAHHAGVTRPESLASLYGLDEVLGTLDAFATSGVPPRRYRIVVVSDHGQSQGATFLQREGCSLEEFVARTISADSSSGHTPREGEAWGPVNLFLRQLSAQESPTARVVRRADRRRVEDTVLDGGTPPSPDGDRPEIVVVGSGNLGGIWFARHRERLRLRDLEDLHPGLLEALATHPAVGFVVVLASSGPVAIGAEGTHDLVTGRVVGTDPLLGFPDQAAADFRRVAEFAEAPDIYVNSLFDPGLDEVAAFEELVGCHGGVGGWQTRPLLIHPADWTVDPDLLDAEGRLVGAERVHAQLVRWLERAGHRRGPDATALADAVTTPADERRTE